MSPRAERGGFLETNGRENSSRLVLERFLVAKLLGMTDLHSVKGNLWDITLVSAPQWVHEHE
jgi:hypothetical protein